MKINHLLSVVIVVTSNLASFAKAQPATHPHVTIESRTAETWAQLQAVERETSRTNRASGDPENLHAYDDQIERLELASLRLSTLKVTGTDPLLAAHISECAKAYHAMAYALHMAQHELVPAAKGLRSELRSSKRGQTVAKDLRIDLASVPVNEQLFRLSDALKDDSALAEESRFLAVQSRLVSEGAASLARSEERLRETFTARQRVAAELHVRYGPNFPASSLTTVLWTW